MSNTQDQKEQKLEAMLQSRRFEPASPDLAERIVRQAQQIAAKSDGLSDTMGERTLRRISPAAACLCARQHPDFWFCRWLHRPAVYDNCR